ncbi:tRNA-dihydrouridine(47) synthase [NAD(P)(+)] [Aspergillus sergii]|uniref:tRNA-dihydrouridine(47) synthase [NAD(P)(+)] n=1 Tax=Aspergillus sergii TaxID=1034303 RepID=A0A5N6WUN9_9EURO|nr:tRNA-dihydrouridine(47) synthase [NAD(P)(+)] [Aspergillus sergii]
MAPETAQSQTPETTMRDLQNDAPVTDTLEADNTDERPSKKAKLDDASTPDNNANSGAPQRMRGVAPVKPEFIIPRATDTEPQPNTDDAAEAARHEGAQGQETGKKKKKKPTGQNTNRTFGSSQDEKGLCPSRIFTPEFSPGVCQWGEKCRFEHDLRTYLKEYKRGDLTTFDGVCPVWDAKGKCLSGWKCRLVGSHMTERETADGRKELVLVEDEERKKQAQPLVPFAAEDGTANIAPIEAKIALNRKKVKTPRADAYGSWLDKTSRELEKVIHNRKGYEERGAGSKTDQAEREKEDNRAQYLEPPFLPSEKRRIYFGPETPVLAPLTTQGNLPFRRLCIELGAQFTYSEMALSMPLIQGQRGEWALMRAHETEMLPPTISPGADVVQGYDHSKDFRFGAQIAANKHWQALKATEVLSAYTPNLRVIDLNCGCPIDLLFREGAGSALLEHPSKLERILRGMNAVSQEIPITAKIRMGTRDNSPNALKLAERLVLGGYESSTLGLGAPGVAALTLHGRSRQQRYTKQADWGYISECAALIKRLNEKTDQVTDTVREPDPRTQPNGGKTWFLGNGDCYSHLDYDDHVNNAGVDTVMVGRGALIKPWLFEEIQAGQYLDKSASERLSLVEKFAKYGLETWGSDEHGVGTTRRFLLEWLSFACRYIPIGLLEYLPPRIQDRPPSWRGRNELETLMGSHNYKDWIKITEMFLGPAHKDFRFEPKHKSNAWEAEAEG